MPKAEALAAMFLEGPPYIPEYDWLDHPALMAEVSGLDPFEHPTEAHKICIEKLRMDWVVGLHGRGMRFQEGEIKQEAGGRKKYTEWGISGSEWEAPPERFKSPEDVLAFDPFTSDISGISVLDPNWSENIPDWTLKSREILGDTALVTGCYYCTLFMWFVMTFGWELFLITAASYPKKFARLIDRFAELTAQRYRDWVAKDDSPIFHTHDDIAITQGLVFGLDWYRENFWPHYERNFDILKRAGKKIIFVSDGNYTEALDDLAALGVDGFIIDHTMDLEAAVEKYGQTKVLAGNVNIDVLTRGTPDDVKKEVKRCADIGRDAPGFFFRCIGDLPHNIPLENIKTYFQALVDYGRR